MDIFQLVGIAVSGAMFSVIIKAYRPELAICVALTTACVLMFFAVGALGNITEQIITIMDRSGLDRKYFSAILKIIGISYMTELGSEICKDAGQSAIALKLEMVGKIMILLLSMPIIDGFLEVCISAISML